MMDWDVGEGSISGVWSKRVGSTESIGAHTLRLLSGDPDEHARLRWHNGEILRTDTMQGHAFRWFCVMAGSLLLGIPVSGQARLKSTLSNDASHEQTHLGYPQDWSSRHLVMPGMRAEDVLAAGDREPRHVYNMVMRQMAVENLRRRVPRPRPRMKIDWAVSLENGYVPQNQFPAKYRFDVGAEDCNSDFIVFGLTGASGTQANLVGINNLYTEAAPQCNRGSPWVEYDADAAYVGADNGLLYKITPVFGGGQPVLVSDPSNWPVTVSTQAIKILTAPVVDNTAGLIFIGDGEGYLYSVKLTSPGKTFVGQQT